MRPHGVLDILLVARHGKQRGIADSKAVEKVEIRLCRHKVLRLCHIFVIRLVHREDGIGGVEQTLLVEFRETLRQLGGKQLLAVGFVQAVTDIDEILLVSARHLIVEIAELGVQQIAVDGSEGCVAGDFFLVLRDADSQVLVGREKECAAQHPAAADADILRGEVGGVFHRHTVLNIDDGARTVRHPFQHDFSVGRGIGHLECIYTGMDGACGKKGEGCKEYLFHNFL